MYGIVTRNEEELDCPEFDRGFFEVKNVTGRVREPTPAGANLLSCFGDDALISTDESMAPVTSTGEMAMQGHADFDFSYVCPSHDAYRQGLLAIIEDCVKQCPDVRLDEVGFPGSDYCHCPTCSAAFEESEEDWLEWRSDTVTSFVQAAADRIPGRLSLTVDPDPYPGHLYERAGIDLEVLSTHVDEFVVPLYDTSYDTTYWVGALASGFADRLDVELGVEVYAANVTVDALDRVVSVLEPYADTVYFGFDSSTARAVLRRRRATERDGVTHR